MIQPKVTSEPKVNKMTNLTTTASAVAPIWTNDQIKLVKSQICKDITDDELKLFAHVCQRSGLDPFARQIYAVKRKDGTEGNKKMTIQTGIDGFRLIATRSGAYAGKDEARFEYNDKNEVIKCTLTVYKIVQGVRCGWTASAKWDEYYPGDYMGKMWLKLPETMLEKCCESKALRMAFPAELSGLYSPEEMAQAGPSPEEQKEALEAELRKNGVVEEGYRVPADAKYAHPKIKAKLLHNCEPEYLKISIEGIEKHYAGKKIPEKAAEFIAIAEKYLGDLENNINFGEDVE